MRARIVLLPLPVGRGEGWGEGIFNCNDTDLAGAARGVGHCRRLDILLRWSPMLASLFTTLLSLGGFIMVSSPLALLITAFQLWMFVDAIRQREYIWAAIIIFGWGLAALWYYLWVYRGSPSTTRGFELPGAFDRRRMKELESQIHYLDKAHHHLQLGDIYFQKGKLEKAESCYRASIERDPQDIDTRAHLGQCLLRLKRPAEARPLLEGAIAENPKHDYGYSMMALAETMTALH